MQLSALTLFVAAAFADDSSDNTATVTSYITKVVSQHTTYVPMAVTFLANVQNVTYANGTSAGNTTAANSTAANTTSAAHSSSSSSSSAAENGAARVAGLSIALAGAALLL